MNKLNIILVLSTIHFYPVVVGAFIPSCLII